MRKTFIYAILAGICIGIGGTAYLSVDNEILGALLFSIGLFAILAMGFKLFTAKVCYIFDNKPSYLIDLLLMWIGNLIGAGLFALLIRFTRIQNTVAAKAKAIVDAQLNDSPLSILLLSIGCGICIYIAVQSFREQHNTLKSLIVILPIMVLVLCKFEHVVTNMFYFTVCSSFTVQTFVYIMIMTLGNAIGGILFPVLRRLSVKKPKEEKEDDDE